MTLAGFGEASRAVLVLGTETDQNAHSLQMAQMLLNALFAGCRCEQQALLKTSLLTCEGTSLWVLIPQGGQAQL